MWAVIMLLVAALMAPSPDKTYLTTRVYPAISLIDSRGGSKIVLTAEIKGPETEAFYCPQIVWELGSTTAKEESDCAPFEQRHQCQESQEGCGLKGWKRDPITGDITDVVKECPCTITGYPRIWRRTIYAGPGPENGEPWSVWVRLVKNGKTIARQEFRFWVKG